MSVLRLVEWTVRRAGLRTRGQSTARQPVRRSPSLQYQYAGNPSSTNPAPTAESSGFASELNQKIVNIRANPVVAVGFDHYTEVWASLQGVVIHGQAYLVDSVFEFRRDRDLLYEKYTQYATDAPIEEGESVIVEVRVDRVVSWGF